MNLTVSWSCSSLCTCICKKSTSTSSWNFPACNGTHILKTFSPTTCCCSVAKSGPTLFDSMDCNPLGSSIHGISRQEYWSRLPFPSQGDLPDPGIKLLSPALAFLSVAFAYYIPENTVWIVQSLKSCMSLYPGQRKIIQRPSAGLGMYIQWYQKYRCMSK